MRAEPEPEYEEYGLKPRDVTSGLYGRHVGKTYTEAASGDGRESPVNLR